MSLPMAWCLVHWDGRVIAVKLALTQIDRELAGYDRPMEMALRGIVIEQRDATMDEASTINPNPVLPGPTRNLT